jgi:TRAP-type C4-dicarboxylate transport system permease small subunit
LKQVTEIITKLNKGLWSFGSILLLLISLAVCFDVITRYAFGFSSEWVGEFSGYLLVCIAYMSSPHALYIGRMTKVDLILSKVGPRTKKTLTILAHAISLVYLVIMLRESGKLVYNSFTLNWRSSTQLRTPLWIPQAILPAGVFLMVATNVLLLIQAVITKPEAPKPRVKLSDDEIAQQILKEAKEEVGNFETPRVKAGEEGKGEPK